MQTTYIYIYIYVCVCVLGVAKKKITEATLVWALCIEGIVTVY